jgi:PAS domain S-box-containing protein
MKVAAREINSRGRGVLKDISAPRGMEPALTRECQAILKNNGKPMVIVETDTTISLVNAEFVRLSGYTKEEIEGKKSWMEFVARDDRKRAKEYHRLRRTDPILSPRCFEFRFLNRQGKIKNVVLTIGQIPGTTKNMASLLNVTDRRQAEATQRVSEERYKSIFEKSRDAIYITTYNGTYVDANQAALDLFGYAREELKKLNAGQLYADPADARRFQKEIEEKGFVRDFEVPLRKKDGTVMDCLFTVTAQRGDDGDILEYQGIIRDITERKRMEEGLRENEERYRTLVDNIDLGVNLIDADHTIVMVNAAGSRQINKPVSELIGKKCFREFEKRDAMCPHCPGVRAMATGKPAEVETEGVRDDGSCYNVRIQAFPVFRHDGAVTGFIEISEGITERKRIEELLQQERETFSTILQNALYGVVLIDRDGKYLYVNPEFTAITGYTLEDIPTGRDWMHKAYPDKEYRQKVVENWKKDSGSEGMISRVFSVVCKDGEIKEIEFRPAQLADRRAIVMLADITERKRAEEALQKSREELQTIMDASPIAMAWADLHGNIQYINRKHQELFGYTLDEIPTIDEWRRQADQDPVQREKFASWQEELMEAQKDGRSFPPLEMAVTCKDGSIRHVVIFGALASNRSLAFYSDITERKRAEEALQKSREELQTLMDASPIAISWADKQGNIIYINHKHHKLFGYTLDEIPTIDEWRRQADHDPVQREKFASWPDELVEAHKDGRSLPPREMIVTCKDGSIRHVTIEGTIVSDRNLVIYNDITERKQAEELLRQEKETFFTILQNALYGVALMSGDGKHVFVNPEFTAITGYTLEDIPTGRDWMHKAYPDKEYRQKVIENWKKDGELGGTRRVLSVVCKDGKIKEIETSRTPLDNGLSVVMLTDITERKRAEEALRESEERFRLLVEHSTDALFLHDFDGKIIDVNQHACESLGYTREELLSLPLQDIDENFSPGKLTEQWKQVVPGAPLTLDGIHRRKDGTTFPVEVRLGVFEAGRRRLLLGLVRDITARKRAEERLQRYAADLERSNEEVKNFAYIVSHDLRVPLVNLKGYSAELRSALEVIGSNFDAALPYLNDEKRSEVAMALHEDAPEALEFITNSVSRMDSFINSVLMLSRLGRRDLKLEPIDMNALVQASLEALAHQIQERGIKVTTESLPQVVADRTSMEQIMGNIFSNAVKYLDSSCPGRIEVTAQANGAETTFRIRDNGRGIAEEDMGKVFAPFRRAGKQDTPGEGMGLAYVQAMLRRHNGRIWCESELGKGTTFIFTIAAPSEQGAYNA